PSVGTSASAVSNGPVPHVASPTTSVRRVLHSALHHGAGTPDAWAGGVGEPGAPRADESPSASTASARGRLFHVIAASLLAVGSERGEREAGRRPRVVVRPAPRIGVELDDVRTGPGALGSGLRVLEERPERLRVLARVAAVALDRLAHRREDELRIATLGVD